MNFRIYRLVIFFLLITPLCNAQEGLPIYTDYLTDNNYLIHPSMAGVSTVSSKIRLTARQQWLGQDDAPSLMTASINGRVNEYSPSAIGGILYSDKNGYHSQKGAYLTYAHHLMFSRNPIDLNMLSFGLSAGFIQYNLDESEFLSAGFDPIISGIKQSSTNFNMDLGMSYQFISTYIHATIKNILKNDGINNDIEVTNNLRRYLFSVGSVFHTKRIDTDIEPSVMIQYKEGTKETILDFNFKMYKDFEKSNMYFGLSYRVSLDGTQYLDGSGESKQKLQYITPIFGVSIHQFVFSYAYNYQANSVVFNNGGFHQFSLGYNFNIRRPKYDGRLPANN
ncbi:type IX secretion system membrane protein PorP/SprF [Formosa sp. L2A11]|uniref:PorP/SprF family type IX secretion system membrane protein n=1 Tax=Formosa sp. L2A11 TaxID=2686363 RepID=UPI00131D69F8|nr:type IX secretion system membrane protein PorP/SprF [Formosa sp. L2A11]